MKRRENAFMISIFHRRRASITGIWWTNINVDGIEDLVNNYMGRMKFQMGAKPEFVLKLSKEEKRDILRQAEFVVADISQLLITSDNETKNGGTD